MPKRFTSTEIWAEDWYLEMPNDYKLFWHYMLSTCNHAGLFKVNLRSFCGLFGVNIEANECLKYFNNGKYRINPITINLWYIEDFFVYQYGTNFNINNRVHKSIKKELEKVGILVQNIRGLKGVNDTLKDKDKDNNTYSIDTIENNKNGVEVFSPLLDQFGFIDPKEAEMRYLNAEQYKSSLDEMAMIHHTSVSNVTAWVKKFTSKLIIEGWKNAMTEWIRYFSNWMNKNYSPGEIKPSTISGETKAEKYQRLIRENKELLKNARPNS